MKTIGTCKTCVHWHREMDVTYQINKERTRKIKHNDLNASRVLRFWDIEKKPAVEKRPLFYGFCSHPKMIFEAELSLDGIVWDYTSWNPPEEGDEDGAGEVDFPSPNPFDFPGLLTGKDFGCVLWKKKKKGD